MEYNKRFKDANYFKESQKLPVTVGGAGSLGSWAALYLVRKGCSVTIFDFDKVENHNIGGQLYGGKHLEQYKVVALKQIISDLMPINPPHLTISAAKYGEDTPTNTVSFSCFDNMTARKQMFNNWLIVCEYTENTNKDKPLLFVDARLAHDNFEVYPVDFRDKDSIKEYKKTLFSDEESNELPCSLQYSTEYASMASSIMVTMLNNYLSNRKLEEKIYELKPKQFIGSLLKLMDL